MLYIFHRASHTLFLVKFISEYFILFDDIVNGNASLIHFQIFFIASVLK